MEEYISCLLIIFAIFVSPATSESHGFSVEEEYKKGYVTPERVAALRDWVSTQPHLPGEHITDRDLLLAFNSSNGCLDDARQKLDHYLTVRTMFTDLFKDTVMSDWWLNNTLNSAYIAMVTDLLQYKEGTWPGMILIVDVQNYTKCHMDKMKPLDVFLKYFYYFESAWLGHMEEYHYINSLDGISDLEMLLQKSMSELFFKKLYKHKNMKSFENHYPIEGLPEEAGGKSKSIKEFQDSAFEEMKANQDYFVADRKKRVDETKRPGGPKNISHIMRIIRQSFSDHHRSYDPYDLC